jgi:hypothetical protein
MRSITPGIGVLPFGAGRRSWVCHAAARAGCGLDTVAIFRQPSILRNLVCPLATG